YARDNGGDENFNVYAVSLAAKAAANDPAPRARDLTGMKGVRARVYGAAIEEPDVVYVGLNNRDRAWHDLYKVNLMTGELTLVWKNTTQIAEWIFDSAGRLALARRVAQNGDQEYFRLSGESMASVYKCTVFETCSVVRAARDGLHLYIATN